MDRRFVPKGMRCALAFVLAAFLAPAVVNPSPAGIRNIVILGDSLARGAGDETGRGIAGALAALTDARIENLGINGARTAVLMRHLAKAQTRQAVRRAELIIVSIGGNDLFGNSIEKFRSLLAPRVVSHLVLARVERVIARIREENRTARIVVLGLYNPYRQAKFGKKLDMEIARWDARLIATFAGDRALNVVRITDLIDTPLAISPRDHYHPSAFGYRLIAERVWAAESR